MNVVQATIVIVHTNHTIQVELDQTTSIQEIFDFLKDQENIPGNTNQWTCFNQEKKIYQENNEMLGSPSKQTLRINVFGDAKIRAANFNLLQSRISPSIFEVKFCQHHPGCQLQFICTENHQCQRRLCAECQQDQAHRSLNNTKILPLQYFKEKIKSQAQETLNKKSNYKVIQMRLKKILLKVQELMSQQQKSLEDAILRYSDSFQMATELLKNLEQEEILDNSNSVLEEMILIYQQNLIQKQGIVNNINLKTIEENLNKFNSIVDQFQQNIATLDFTVISQYECQVNLEQSNPKIIYNGINLCSITPEHEYYVQNLILVKGKYLISQTKLKVDIFNNFQLIESFPLEIQSNITLKDIGKFIKEQCKITPHDIEQWAYYSQTKNRNLEDFDQTLYHFIVSDHIKINVASTIGSQKISNSMINLKINIQDKDEIKVLRQSFSKQCTISDLEEAVLEFTKISNDQNDAALVYISICGRLYRNEIKRKKTLFQLQIQPDTTIQAIIRRACQKNAQKSNAFTVLLQFEIQDGQNKLQFSQKFLTNDTLCDVKKAMDEVCNLQSVYSFIDVQIQGYSYNQEQNSTLGQLGFQDNTKIIGYVRWQT